MQYCSYQINNFMSAYRLLQGKTERTFIKQNYYGAVYLPGCPMLLTCVLEKDTGSNVRPLIGVHINTITFSSIWLTPSNFKILIQSHNIIKHNS